ncbi:MAG: DUF951 domain-containing protein [Bacillota bacterium]
MSPERPDVRVGDVVVLRKPHPCGSDRWEILRIGADFRLRCLGCGRLVMLPRSKVERRIKRVIRPDGDPENSGDAL